MTRLLAFDGGGTATRAGLYDRHGQLLKEASGGPSNPTDLGVDECVNILSRLGFSLTEGKTADEVAAGLSGAGRKGYAGRIARMLADEFAARRAVVTTDVFALLKANLGTEPGILVVAGTGSCVIAQTPRGETARFGGRGPVFADVGSAYALATRALRAAADYVDGVGRPTGLAYKLLEPLQLNDFTDLADWAATARKPQIAGLASVVNSLAERGDEVASAIIEEEAQALARLVTAALEQIPGESVPVVMHGGALVQALFYREQFELILTRQSPRARPRLAEVAGHGAVAALARTVPLPPGLAVYISPEAVWVPPTERPSLETPAWDRLAPIEMVRRMAAEGEAAAKAVAREAEPIAAAIEAAGHALREGGRIIYLGAGTSGRLGALDASECPPTFGVQADRVVGFIAGGDRALRESIEGAEDDKIAAVADLERLQPTVNERDIVIGITASGTTPYVLAGLERAKASKAKTVLLCCNPRNGSGADIVIILNTGAEVLAGSTRLKAGTATKIALNAISTGAMALAGYVYEGRMVRLAATNAKLRRRAIGIVAELTGKDDEEAGKLLDEAGGRIPAAIIMARRGVDRAAAEKTLEMYGGNLREALDEP